jgi:lipopolysaccharide export system permease protein
MILDRYFGQRFLRSFVSVFAVFFAMLFMIDIIEQVRKFRSDDAGLWDLVTLTLLNVPQAIYAILPLIMIIATIALFLSLARSSEMVVTRAAGRSALRALVAPVSTALIIGLVAIGLFNPIVAATSKEYEARAGNLQGENSILAVSESGLWLRQGGDTGQTVIRARRTNLDGTELTGATFITFGEDGAPERRIEAGSARLTEGAWQLSDVKIWDFTGTDNPEAEAERADSLVVPSTLTPDQIRDSFGTPNSIPIWELPRFIKRLQDAGFAARRHQVFFHMELALPAFLIAMVLIGAGFTMRHQRGGRTGIMVLLAILLSFAVYFLRNFAQILGETGDIPVLLAAWAPPLVGIGLSLGLLLHLEDG